MAIQDVGLRARLDNLQQYLAGAKQVQASTLAIGQASTQAARQSQAASTSILGSLRPIAGALAGAFAVGAITRGISGTIAAASNLSETVNKIDVVFGSAAASVKAFGETSAQALGMSKNEALSAAGTFGNLFTTMGLGQKESADFSKQLVQNAADLASFNNIDPTIVLQKLQSGLVGEIEPLRALGIDVSDAAISIEALRQGITKATKDMTQAEKIQLRYAVVQKQMSNSAGDFARTSTGLANSQRILAAAFADIQAEIGMRLLPVIAPLVSQFATSLPAALNAAKPALDAFGSTVQTVFAVIGQLSTQLAPVKDAFAALGQTFGTFGATVGPGVTAAFESIAGTVEAAMNRMLDIAVPILDDLWNQIVEGWAQIQPLIGPVLDAIGTRVQEGLALIRNLWATYGEDIWNVVKTSFEGIGQIVSGVLDVVITIIRGNLQILGGDWTQGWETLATVPEKAWGLIKTNVQAILNSILAVVKVGVRALGVETLWYDLRDFILQTWTGIRNGIAGEINKIIGDINRLINAVNSVAGLFGTSLLGTIQPISMEDFIVPPRPGWFTEPVMTGIEQVYSDPAVQASGKRFSDWLGGLFGAIPKLPAISIGTDPMAAIQANMARGAGIASGAQDAEEALGKVGRAGADAGSGVASGAQAGREALRGLQEEAQRTQIALGEAQAAMRAFSDPRLVGMQAAEDELFDLDQQIKRARLAELQLGDAAKDTSQEVGDSFDVLGAQRRELAEGIPVAMQKYEDELRRAQSTAAQPAPITAAAGESEVQRLQRIREIKQLQMELNFEPQQRSLRELFETLTGANREITFDQAKGGLEGSAAAAVYLSQQLEQQQAVIAAQEIVLEAQQASTAQIQAVRATTAGVESAISANYDAQSAALASQLVTMNQINTLMATTQAQSAAVAANTASAVSSWGTMGGVQLPSFGTAPGLAEGGTVTRGGMAMVGERGPELAVLPSGTTVLPHSVLQPASVNRTSHQDNWNISGASRPIDVADHVRRVLAWERLRGGRRG